MMASADDDSDEYTSVVVTCSGNINDPDLGIRLDDMTRNLQRITSDDEQPQVMNVEPWNSVRVTLKVSRDSAALLQQLAQRRDLKLMDIGVLSVQVDGGNVLRLDREPQASPLKTDVRENVGICGRTADVQTEKRDVSVAVTGSSQLSWQLEPEAKKQTVIQTSLSSPFSTCSGSNLSTVDPSWHPLAGQRTGVSRESASSWDSLPGNQWNYNGMSVDPFQFSADDLLTRMLADVPTPKRRHRLRKEPAALSCTATSNDMGIGAASSCGAEMTVSKGAKSADTVYNSSLNSMTSSVFQMRTRPQLLIRPEYLTNMDRMCSDVDILRNSQSSLMSLPCGLAGRRKTCTETNDRQLSFGYPEASNFLTEISTAGRSDACSDQLPAKRRRVNSRTALRESITDAIRTAELSHMSGHVSESLVVPSTVGSVASFQHQVPCISSASVCGSLKGAAEPPRLAWSVARVPSASYSTSSAYSCRMYPESYSCPASTSMYGYSPATAPSSAPGSAMHVPNIGLAASGFNYPPVAGQSGQYGVGGDQGISDWQMLYGGSMRPVSAGASVDDRERAVSYHKSPAVGDSVNTVPVPPDSMLQPHVSSCLQNISSQNFTSDPSIYLKSGRPSSRADDVSTAEISAAVKQMPQSSVTAATFSVSPRDTWAGSDSDYFGTSGTDSGVASNTSLSVGSDHSENERASAENTPIDAAAVKQSPLVTAPDHLQLPASPASVSAVEWPTAPHVVESKCGSVSGANGLGMTSALSAGQNGEACKSSVFPAQSWPILGGPAEGKAADRVRLDARTKCARRSRQTPALVGECPPAITCPSLPRRLSESVKRAMRGGGSTPPDPPMASPSSDANQTKVVIRITKTRCPANTGEARRSKQKEQWCVQPILKPLQSPSTSATASTGLDLALFASSSVPAPNLDCPYTTPRPAGRTPRKRNSARRPPPVTVFDRTDDNYGPVSSYHSSIAAERVQPMPPVVLTVADGTSAISIDKLYSNTSEFGATSKGCSSQDLMGLGIVRTEGSIRSLTENTLDAGTPSQPVAWP